MPSTHKNWTKVNILGYNIEKCLRWNEKIKKKKNQKDK